MKKMVRGAIAILALSGLSACVDDPLLPLNGDADQVHANPTIMNVRQGDSSAVLLRLINAANRATPTKFDISNVGAGIVVNLDPKFRPEYVNGSDTLIVPEIKSVQRYFIRGISPGEFTYTVTSNGISGTFKVRVEPIDLGAALSRTTAVAGDDVTITAPVGTTFTPTATVTFATGSVAIKSRAADNKSIVVTAGPGITGAATVAGLTLDYFPALPALTLATTNTLTTPALTSAPFTFSANTALVPVTVTATGFKFRPNFTLTFGTRQAWTVSVAADSNSAVVIMPTGLANATPTGSNVALAFLPAVALTNLTGPNTVTTAATTAWNGANPDGTAPAIVAAAAGTIVDFFDTGDINYGDDILGNGGPNKWYRLNLPSAGNRNYTLDWTSAADMDLYVTNLAVTTAYVARATLANPETGATNQPAGNYLIGISNFGGEYPGIVRIRIQ